MQIDNGTIKRNALQLIIAANAALVDSARPFAERLRALHLLFNVVDHVLGLMTNEYVSPAFKAEHARYSEEWHKALNIRTCDDCGTHMHDMYAVPCESPTGDVFVFCETCAILHGSAEVCTQCTLVYAHADMVDYVPHYLTESTLRCVDHAHVCARVCVDCFSTLSPH